MKLFCAGIGLNTWKTGASRSHQKFNAELCEKNGVTLENLIGYDGITFSNSNKAKQLSVTKEEIYKAVSLKIEGKDNRHIYWSDINLDELT